MPPRQLDPRAIGNCGNRPRHETALRSNAKRLKRLATPAVLPSSNYFAGLQRLTVLKAAFEVKRHFVALANRGSLIEAIRQQAKSIGCQSRGASSQIHFQATAAKDNGRGRSGPTKSRSGPTKPFGRCHSTNPFGRKCSKCFRRFYNLFFVGELCHRRPNSKDDVRCLRIRSWPSGRYS